MTDAKALTFIEVDIDYCSLTYGVPPCMAVLGTAEEVADGDATGTIKCFNSLGTCQDRANFANAPVTMRFAKPASYLPQSGVEIVEACILEVDYSPAIISLGEGLGQRASLRVTFKDFPHEDTGPGFDKYLANRDYAPYGRGTFWGKFRARHPFQRGRSIRLIQGLLGQDLADMETRHFVIESFEGPSLDGRYTLVAKDPLKFASGDRAQAPLLNRGKLVAPIDADDTTATLTPTGIGDAEYAAEGYVNIGGKEIVGFTRSGDTLTITRAQFETEAVAHEAGDKCQQCLYYQAEDPADINYDLFTTYTETPAGYITLADWQAETAAYYGRVNTALIAEPTAVDTLVSELIEEVGLAIWWDDVAQKIRLQVLRAIPTTAETFDARYAPGEANVVENTLRVREQPQKRISRVQTFFGLKSPFEPLDEPWSYRSSALTPDLEAEANDGKAIKTIYSRWIPFGGLTAAARVNQIQLGRYRTAPRHFDFQLSRRGEETPALGEGCRLFGLPMQDATGAYENVPIQITRLNPRPDVWEVEAEEMRFVQIESDDGGGTDLTIHPITIDASILNINLRTLHDSLYPAPAAKDTVNVTINSGVIVGSSSTAVAAFIVGDWPTQAVTGNRTSGSAVLSGLDVDTADWARVGQRVFGTGIPAGAKIASIDSSSQVTLDMNATSGSGTSTALTVHTVIVNLAVRGRVQGKGGNGGQGADTFGASDDGLPGQAGGPALYSRYGVNIDLTTGGQIWGGGGGGGGASALTYSLGDGGGGGAGSLTGAGGPIGGSSFGEVPGAPGTAEAGGEGGRNPTYDSGAFVWGGGGDGGGPGLAGSAGTGIGGGRDGGAGGAAGGAIDGVSYLTKTGAGDIRGSETN